MNDNMARYAARNVIKLMVQNGIDVSKSRVAVLGITFKENCPDIRNSKVVDLVTELKSWGIEVLVTDDWADANEVGHEYGIQLTQFTDLKNVDSVIVAVGHHGYRKLNLAELKRMCRGEKPVLGDLKSLYDKHAASSAGFKVFRL